MFPADALLRQSGGDQPRGTLAVVPGNHPVIKTQDHIGHSQIVVARYRQAFQDGPPVVADVARNATLKWRNSGNQRERRVWKQAPRYRQRVVRGAGPAALTVSHLGVPALTAYQRDRVCG